MYEHPANGTLDRYFRKDGNRKLLTADIRLSIMFELTRAVHFLDNYTYHGYDNYKFVHRHIQSANICLSKDYTIQLIDCGRSKLVTLNSRTSTTWSVVNCASPDSSTFGTPRYMCPEYETNWSTLPHSYTAAYDVYAVGIVLVELILGSLIGGQTSGVKTQYLDAVFHECVRDDEGNDIPDGWKLLKEHKDRSVEWTPESLNVVCNAAISCLKQSASGRMTTTKLLPMLSEAIHLNAGTIRFKNSADPVKRCALCYLDMPIRKCDKGHAVCATCIENKIRRGLSGGSQLPPAVCPFDGCSSYHKYLYGFISPDVYDVYIENQDPRAEEFKRIDKLVPGLDRTVASMSFLAAKHLKECPHLVWITSVQGASGYPSESGETVTDQKYNVVFICAHSYKPGHYPFEIKVPKSWIEKIAPWLKFCLQVMQLVANSQASLIPDIKSMIERMNSFLDSVKQQGKPVCDSSPNETFHQVKLASDAFELIAEEAKNAMIWKDTMVPVFDTDKGLIWVIREYENEYSPAIA